MSYDPLTEGPPRTPVVFTAAELNAMEAAMICSPSTVFDYLRPTIIRKLRAGAAILSTNESDA